MFAELGTQDLGIDDFRTNGLLLPSSDAVAIATALPLHRGPHRQYNQMVAERMGQIEGSWRKAQLRDSFTARSDALMRIGLLKMALRRRLMDGRKRPLKLNSRDPFRSGHDFAELDAMADALWGATAFTH